MAGGSTAPWGECDKYRSFRDTFLMPTMRLSTSSSMIRSTRRNGYRCGRMRSIAPWSSGSVRSMRTKNYIVGAADRPINPFMTTTSNTTEQLTALFALGREVASVLDLDELLQKIPQLIARLMKFQAFAVYLLDERRGELRVAYSVGYPEDVARTLHFKVGQGLVGAAVAEGQPILVNDVHADPRYVEAVPGSNSELVVPLRRKGRVIGALNLL